MTILERGSRNTVTLLDIRLDSDVIILRGSAVEAAGAILKGVLTFCLQDSLAVRGIHLKLVGVERVGHEPATKSRSVKHEKVIYEKDWQFLDFEHDHKKSFVLGPGNYEYPFEQILPGSLPESVEGLDQAYIVYRMKATIERPRFSQDISAKKHLRVVRTLAPGDEALSSTMAVENIWPGKCEYSISIPAKACVFGTSIPLDVGIISLLKGLTIGTVTCALREFHTFSIPEKNTKKQDTRTIQTATYHHGGFQDMEDGTEKWVMHALIELPKSLSKCVQDCEASSIKVRHKLRVSVQLHNPDGHTSELRASLPVQIFISPNHLIGEDNEIHSVLPFDYSLHEVTAVPPRYDDHIYDRLWDDLPHEYSTPLPSGSNTPAILSRNNSYENIASMMATSRPSLNSPNVEFMGRLSRSRSSERPGTASSYSTATTSDRASAEDLQATLAGSADNAHALPTAHGHGDSISTNPGRVNGVRSTSNTRPASPEDLDTISLQAPTMQRPLAPLNINDLCRVPSYRTAMRSENLKDVGDVASLPRYEGGGWNGYQTPPASPPSGRDSSPHPPSRTRRLGFSLRGGHGHSGESGDRHHHHTLSLGLPVDADRRLRVAQARGR